MYETYRGLRQASRDALYDQLKREYDEAMTVEDGAINALRQADARPVSLADLARLAEDLEQARDERQMAGERYRAAQKEIHEWARKQVNR